MPRPAGDDVQYRGRASGSAGTFVPSVSHHGTCGTVTVVTNFHDITMSSITGQPVSFDEYKGKVCLIVNVASA